MDAHARVRVCACVRRSYVPLVCIPLHERRSGGRKLEFPLVFFTYRIRGIAAFFLFRPNTYQAKRTTFVFTVQRLWPANVGTIDRQRRRERAAAVRRMGA